MRIVGATYGDIFKASVSSKTFDAGTAELLSNVLNLPNPYDYRSQDGDTLTLSAAGKGQVNPGDISSLAEQLEEATAESAEEEIPQAVKDFFAKYAKSGKGMKGTVLKQVPDSVKDFFKEHSKIELHRITLDEIPDEVKNDLKKLLLTGTEPAGQSGGYFGIRGIGAVDPDETARMLVNSLFVNAHNQNFNSSGNSQDLAASNQAIYSQVTDGLNLTFQKLDQDSANLPPTIKESLRSIHLRARRMVDHWAAVNGIQTATEGK